MSYDLQCLMLAEHFYPEWSEAQRESLAQEIQDVVEGYCDVPPHDSGRAREACIGANNPPNDPATKP